MNFTSLFSLVSMAWAIPFPSLQEAFPTSPSRFELSQLPMVDRLPRSWAGKLAIPYRNHDEMFFWLFEAETEEFAEQLIIWLNGGPGCSSLISMATGNGPFVFQGNDSTPCLNPFSWTKLANVLYVDQPVGTGFSTTSKPLETNIQVTNRFVEWLHEFFTIFPHLKRKKLHLMGESYAGVYIPYFAEAIIKRQAHIGIDVTSISLGDGTFGSNEAMSDMSITAYLLEQHSTLPIPEDMLDAFTSAADQCGFSSLLSTETRRPNTHLSGIPIRWNEPNGLQQSRSKGCNIRPSNPSEINKSIFHSSCYPRCAIFNTALDYLQTVNPCLNMYNINLTCNSDDPVHSMQSYFNRQDVRKVLNIPDSDGKYQTCNSKVLNTLLKENNVEPPSDHIIPSLLAKGVKVHIYEGIYDMLVNHKGIEFVIQNMTWNGHQGLRTLPNQSFQGGTWGYDRGLSYHLFTEAGHTVPQDVKRESFHFVKDFVIDDDYLLS